MHNPKPIIVFEGLDKAGKTTLSKRLSTDLNYFWDNFPTKQFPELRFIGKEKTLNLGETHADRQKQYVSDVELSDSTRMFSHALSHGVCFDIYRKMMDVSDVRGFVLDRFWYSNPAYACTYPSLSPSFIEDVELANQPLVPDMVILLKTPNDLPLTQLDNSHLENEAFREEIMSRYKRLLRQQSALHKFFFIEYVNTPTFLPGGVPNVEESYQRLKSNIMPLLQQI